MNWPTVYRWEWFKLRSRRIIWVLVGLLLIFSAIAVWVRFADYQIQKDRDVVDEIIFLPSAPLVDDFEVELNCTAYLAGAEITEVPPPYSLDDIDHPGTDRKCRQELGAIRTRLDKLIAGFTLPGSVERALRWTGLLSVPIVALLTVMVVGSEYGWGTLRTVLMRGPGRWRVLWAKLALVATIMVVVWIGAIAIIIGSSLVATSLTSGVSHGAVDQSVVLLMARDLARVWVAALPYIALAALLSILFSRFTGGMLAASAIAVGYFFLELFSVGRLVKLVDGSDAFRWFGTMVEYDLGWNTAAWLFGRDGEPISGFALVGAIGTATYPGDLHAFLVQMVAAGLFGSLAFWIFGRRDVTGPAG
jgi:ABC-type transport system involved in multi-copper enzyme maturation permease subunit